MKKKQLASMILVLAVAVSTVFAPVNVAAAYFTGWNYRDWYTGVC